ncbi:MAG: transketolase [Coriobacteriaceae bacterium]|nr:transketolase [Coriobacteriaceae bacterium]
MSERGFAGALSAETAAELRARAHAARGAVLTATSVAGSGHPGGSLSSMEIVTVLYGGARLRPAEPRWPDRDRIVISHGHVSPGVYCALASAGFFDIHDVEAHFRQAGSVFEGHVERSVPGVEWSSGNLGQGLSAGAGLALAARLTGGNWHTFVAMSDGEQMKGQVAEARRLAVKERLCDLTAIVDLNGVQISGHTAEVMPVRVAEDFTADGWRVIECDGHDVEALHAAIAEAQADASGPVAVIAHTVIGKGVSFMEDEPEFHGRALTADEYERAMGELGLEPRLEEAAARRILPCGTSAVDVTPGSVAVAVGTPRTYTREKDTDNRSAWGTAVAEIAAANEDVPIAVFDCDLMTSVKTDAFAKVRPLGFVECGVGEHNAATAAGAASTAGVLSFLADFGVFGLDEAYNQQRLNDINGASLKLALTHCGLDVGEDGKTHQCIDYVSAFRNLFGWRVVVPADPNQTDRAVRWMAGEPGCIAVCMGRSKLPVVLGEDGEPLFGGAYEFRYGRVDRIREGVDAVVLALGALAGPAAEAADALAAEGLRVGVGAVSSPLALDDADMEWAADAPLLVTVEDHSVRSGLGLSVAEWLATSGRTTRLSRLGVEGYASSGASKDLLAIAGLDAAGIAASVRSALRA